jgi:hypothetical protein
MENMDPMVHYASIHEQLGRTAMLLASEIEQNKLGDAPALKEIAASGSEAKERLMVARIQTSGKKNRTVGTDKSGQWISPSPPRIQPKFLGSNESTCYDV